MWHQTKARVARIRQAASAVFKMDIDAPIVARDARPGQFLEIDCVGPSGLFLRRPISIHTIDKESGSIGLLFRVVGEGTLYLSKMREGQSIDVLGPLGTGWPEIVSGRVIMVGGGIGVAPLPAALKHYTSRGFDVAFLLGARGEAELLALDEISKCGIEPMIATDDGSRGHHGFVTDLLCREIALGGEITVLACGPAPMLRATKRICGEKDVKCYVSLEQRMACGVGACMGCSVRTTHGAPLYKKVCVDGPVFCSREVVIEDV